MARMPAFFYPGQKNMPASFKHFKKLNLVLALLVICLQAGFAKGEWLVNEFSGQPPTLYVDHWSTRPSTDRVGNLLVFTEVAPSDFSYTRDGENYVAYYHLEVAIINDREEQIAQDVMLDTTIVDEATHAAAYSWNRLYRFEFDVPAGEYKALIRLVDDHTQQSATYQVPVAVSSMYAKAVNVSDLLIAREEVTVVNPNETRSAVLPYPRKIYDKEIDRLYYYFEIYNQVDSEAGNMSYVISCVGPDDKEIVLSTGEIAQSATRHPLMESFDTANMAGGDYRLRLQLKAPGLPYTIEQEARFSVYQDPTDLRFRNYQTVIDEIRLIAPEEEVNALLAAEKVEQQAAINAFWARRDLTPTTPLNEIKDEYYERIDIARSVFPAPASGGWTDRAKVYILMGAPDELKQVANQNMSRRYETWFYAELNLNVVFEDRTGFGHYQLLEPEQIFGADR